MRGKAILLHKQDCSLNPQEEDVCPASGLLGGEEGQHLRCWERWAGRPWTPCHVHMAADPPGVSCAPSWWKGLWKPGSALRPGDSWASGPSRPHRMGRPQEAAPAMAARAPGRPQSAASVFKEPALHLKDGGWPGQRSVGGRHVGWPDGALAALLCSNPDFPTESGFTQPLQPLRVGLQEAPQDTPRVPMGRLPLSR